MKDASGNNVTNAIQKGHVKVGLLLQKGWRKVTRSHLAKGEQYNAVETRGQTRSDRVWHLSRSIRQCTTNQLAMQ